MLRDQSENNDTEGATQESSDEEQYQRLFKKIARDFICKEDLDHILNSLLEKITLGREEQESEPPEVNTGSVGAIMKAIEYKENLSLPKHKRRKYKDVLDNDE